MRKIKKTIEIAPLFLKDFEKMKLSQNIKNKILSDIENIENGRKIPKPLTGAMFPLKELKYLK